MQYHSPPPAAVISFPRTCCFNTSIWTITQIGPFKRFFQKCKRFNKTSKITFWKLCNCFSPSWGAVSICLSDCAKIKQHFCMCHVTMITSDQNRYCHVYFHIKDTYTAWKAVKTFSLESFSLETTKSNYINHPWTSKSKTQSHSSELEGLPLLHQRLAWQRIARGWAYSWCIVTHQRHLVFQLCLATPCLMQGYNDPQDQSKRWKVSKWNITLRSTKSSSPLPMWKTNRFSDGRRLRLTQFLNWGTFRVLECPYGSGWPSDNVNENERVIRIWWNT